MVSNRRIDNIGNQLKTNNELSPDQLTDLLNWRNSFSPTLDYYYDKLKKVIESEDIDVLARRLKRIESIQIKLTRFKTMRLSTFQDIAGLRVVLKNEPALQMAVAKMRGLTVRHKLKKLDNYHSSPKPDGYRGIHIVYQDSSSRMIEIQFRTMLEHIWATAVEVYGELQNTSFKTGEGDKKWKEFFSLLSSYFAIKEDCLPLEQHIELSKKKLRSKLKKYIRDLKVIETLNASTYGIDVVVKKHNETGRTGKYALLELDLKNKKTNIEIFNKKDVKKAIKKYTEIELSLTKDDLRNIVFVNIENLESIKKSYPNYFLNTQKLLEILSKIVLDQY